MNQLALEINDAAIVAIGGDGLLIPGSGYDVGYATEVERRVVFGHDAWHLARLHPSRTNNRFWSDFSATPLAQSIGGYSTSADLVHAHLESLIAGMPAPPQSVICAVPPGWSTEQLGLLLGLADELSLPIHGLVDSAVAATRCEYAGHDLVHLDIGLHELCVTRLSQNQRIAVQDRQVVANVGIARLEKACAGLIARRLLESTRFDPLHDAHSEQYLYGQLYDWLEALRVHGELAIMFEFGTNEFSAVLRTADVAAAVATVFEPAVRQIRSMIGAGRSVALQVPARLAAFPGVIDSLARLPDVVVHGLEPGAAAWGALHRADQFARDQGGVGLTTALRPDRSAAPARVAETSSVAAITTPTHVLYDGRAYRIGNQVLNIGVELAAGEFGVRLGSTVNGVSRRHCSIRPGPNGAEVVDHSRFGTQLNGHAVSGSVLLQAGDVIRIGRPPVDLQLITEVVPEMTERGA